MLEYLAVIGIPVAFVFLPATLFFFTIRGRWGAIAAVGWALLANCLVVVTFIQLSTDH